MKVGRAGESIIVRLEAGDDILGSIEAACAAHNVTNAEITGLGSIESPTLAHYRMDTKKFTERSLKGIYEVISLTGNIGLVDGRPFAHCHVAISDADMVVHGGHLVSGACSATLEVVIRAIEAKYHKQFDDEIGLKVWRLEETW